MQLTRHTNYGLHELVFVGLRDGVPATVRDVAPHPSVSMATRSVSQS